MIDAHSHPSGFLFQPDLIRIAVAEAGLEKVILFFEVFSLPEQVSTRIIPFVQFQRDRTTGGVLINTEAVRNIRQTLELGKARGIGELSLRHRPFLENPSGDSNPADQPLLLEVYDLAAKHNVPVTVHVEYEYAEELERALSYNREARIIWAHYGDASPPLLRIMMARHPNLYADLSAINPMPGFRNPALAPADSEGNIKPEWMALFLEFPGRFVFGIDMGITERRYRNAHEVVKYYRKVLGQLPAAVAKNIAYDNILVLLGR